LQASDKLIVRLAARDGYTLRQALVPLINHLAATPGGDSPTRKLTGQRSENLVALIV
jgi:urease accessory protein UreH